MHDHSIICGKTHTHRHATFALAVRGPSRESAFACCCAIGTVIIRSAANFLLMFASRSDTVPQQPCRTCATLKGLRVRPAIQAAASKQRDTKTPRKFGGLGDLLGPIGLTLGGKLTVSTRTYSIVRTIALALLLSA